MDNLSLDLWSLQLSSRLLMSHAQLLEWHEEQNVGHT